MKPKSEDYWPQLQDGKKPYFYAPDYMLICYFKWIINVIGIGSIGYDQYISIWRLTTIRSQASDESINWAFSL